MNRAFPDQRHRLAATSVILLMVLSLGAIGCGTSEPLAGDVPTRPAATRTPPDERVVLEEQEQATNTPAPTATNTPRPSPTSTPPAPTATARPATATPVPPTATRVPPTATRVPPTVAPPQPTPAPRASCHASYPDFCIPPSPPDLDCGDIGRKRFTVLPPDPHRFDADNDGIGCES